MKKVYLDTNFFIYILENKPKYADTAKMLFERLLLDCEIETSVITLFEITGRADFTTIDIDNIKQKFYEQNDVNLNNVSLDIINQAINIRFQYKLKTADSIHIATALYTKCDTFVTNDEGLLKVRGIKMLYLEDLIKS